MVFYFAWVKEQENFDPKKHNRWDENIFSLKITQREGEFSSAHVLIKNPRRGLLSSGHPHWAFISQQKGKKIDLLFKGRVMVFPLTLQGNHITLEFTSEPSDSQEKLWVLHQKLKKTSYWDPLFVAPHSLDSPLESLENRSALYTWCRTTGQVDLSDLFEGRHRIVIKRIFSDSLKVSLLQPPLTEISVILETSWTQHASGTVSLGPAIARAFPEGIINTFSGVNFKSKWPKVQHSLGNSGYKIIHSALKEISPPKNSLSFYPQFSDLLWHQDPKLDTDPQQIKLKRYWFQGELKVLWRYRQKRQEQVHFTLHHKTQGSAHNPKRSRVLNLVLQNVGTSNPISVWKPDRKFREHDIVSTGQGLYRCLKSYQDPGVTLDQATHWQALSHSLGLRNPGGASFFLTDRGHHAINHGMDIARAHLAASARAIEISFQGSWEDLSAVTLDHTLILEDDRLPGGIVHGKVVAYQLVADGTKGTKQGWVKIACSLGEGRKESIQDFGKIEDSESVNSYVDPSFVHPQYQPSQKNHHTTPAGITYQNFFDQQSQQGIIHPYALTAGDILEDIQVINPSRYQENYLENHQYPHTKDLGQALKKVPTDLCLRFRSLRTHDILDHRFFIKILEPWTGPKHLDLTHPGSN